MRIIFFGTSSFAASVLHYLIENQFPVVAVVTKQDSEKGRSLQMLPPPVKKMLQDTSSFISIYQPVKASAPEFAEILKAYDADIFLVVAYGEILKINILSIPKKGCINIHASLLPKYRGAAPIHRCIMDGEEKTGITIIEMSKEMDAGDIIAMKEVDILSTDNFIDVELKLQKASHELISKVIQDFKNNTIVKFPQNHAQVTFAAKLSAEDEVIDWKNPAIKILNQIRALSPYPGASCQIKIGDQIKRLKIKKSIVDNDFIGNPGQIVFNDSKKLIVACGNKSLSILEVQLEGKKVMDIENFLRGYINKISFIT